MAASVTDQNFREEIADGIVLVDFWAPWCGPCRNLSPIVDEIAKEFERRVKVVKMNVDDNPQTPGEFGIQSIPTLMLFVDGELTDTMVGFRPKTEIINMINRHLD